jgi:hypothetical protein
VGEPVVGSGLCTGGVLLCDAPGVREVAGVTEPVGVAEGRADRDRDGEDEGVRDGFGEVVVGWGHAVGVEVGWTFDWPALADCGGGTGGSRKYNASTARNRPEMTSVEVRGRPLTRHPRWPGRCRGRPRR